MRALEISKVSPKGRVTLPASILRHFNIKTGQSVTFAATKRGILVKPIEITVKDRTQRPEWERKLEAALEDVKAGRVRRFLSEEEFQRYLKGTSKRKRN